MASRFPEEHSVQLRARKGHDMNWSCDTHCKPIKFFCKDHKVAICHPCATKDHVRSHCELEDIEVVIFEMRGNLEKAGIEETKIPLKTLDTKIESTASSANKYIQSVNDKVNDTYKGKVLSVKDKEWEDLRLINEEADEKIRIINENRERSLKACKEDAEKQQRTIKESEAKLISDLKTINEKVKKKLSELQSKNQRDIDILDNMGSRIQRIKQDDKTLVNEAPQVIASLNEILSSNQEVADFLDRIEREVQKVKFVEGEVGGEHYGRIDGYIGEWELVKSIDIPSIVKKPWVRGLISDDEICVFDYNDKALYVTNIRTENTEKVTQEDMKMSATSCAPADSNVMLCGQGRIMWRGDSLDGCITVYDRQWKVVRDIAIPRNTSSPYSKVYVDVDMDGMILAARYDQSNIYVINPEDGKVVNTITMQGKKVWGRIQALSSGDIIVSTCFPEFTVISRSGIEKTAIHCDEWTSSCCSFDKLTDTLYITYWDKELKVYAVDQVSCDGNIQARRIVKYGGSTRSTTFFSPCLVAPSGKLVAFNGDKPYVYEKKFIL